MNKKNYLNFKVPHTFVIIFFLVLIASILTWVIQPGEFDYENVDVGGTTRNLVVPGSFHTIDPSEAKPVNVIDFASSFHKGLIAAADVVMLIFLVNGSFYVVIKTGAFNALLGSLLRRFYGKEKLIVILLFPIFALCGSLFGMLNAFNGLYPLFVGLGVALGYDAIWGMSIVALGAYIGFAGGTMNPYNVVVAQSIAGVPLYSNMGIRVISLIIFSGVTIFWILRYGTKIRNDPSKSLMVGEETKFAFDKEELTQYEMTNKHKLILFTVFTALIIIIWGSITESWGIIQLTGVFILMGIIAGTIDGCGPSKIANEFIEGCGSIIFGALVTGFARAIIIVMQQGKIVDTIINAMASSLQGLPPIIASYGMLIMHTLINFFIPSGSGQAATTIPIMAPIGDLIGVSREVVCLTFQFGSSFADLLWPTCGITVVCGLAGVPIEKWWKFFGPLFGITFIIQLIIVTVAVCMGM